MVSILVSMPPSEETPFRHSVQERMARERRRIKHSSTYTGRIFTTNIQNMYMCTMNIDSCIIFIVLKKKKKTHNMWTMYTEHVHGCHRPVYVHIFVLKHTQHIRTCTCA